MSNFSFSPPNTSIGGFPTSSPSFATSSSDGTTMASFSFSSNPFASPTSLAPTSFAPTSFLPSSTPSSFISFSEPPSSSSSSSSIFSSSSVIPSSSPASSSIVGTTTVIGATSAVNTVTQVLTSVRTFAPPTSNAPPATSVVLITRTSGVAATINTQPASTRSSNAAASSSAAAGLQANASEGSSSGLGKPGTVAIAVVVPIVAVALLVVAGIFFWRKRKQNKSAREERRKEVEEYGYNPNDDPTLPAVGAAASDSPEMSEGNGYRGWGSNTNGTIGTMSARKPSTNLSSNGIGMAVSDAEGRGHSPGSPGTHPSEGARSSDPLVDGANGGGFGAGAVAGAGGAYAANRAIHGAGGGVQRGPSNASSTYSTGRTDDSGDVMGGAQDLTYDSNYSQYTPYNPNSGGFGDNNSQPIIKDVSARRNTKIENAVYPQPGNSGIAQNF